MKAYILSTVFLLLTLFCGESKAQVITLVGEDAWYPYSAVKDGRLQGFAVDVLAAAYAEVNVTVKFKSAPYARCLMLAQSGQELGCFDSIYSSKLAQNFLFHQEPIFQAQIGIYALSDSLESNLTDVSMRGKVVGVTHGYTYSEDIDRGISIQREVAPTDHSNLRKLLIKRSDYAVIYTRVFDYLMVKFPGEFKGKVKRVGTIAEENLFVSFSKQRPDAVKYADLLDQGLRKIRSNGKYAKLEQKWSSPEP